MSDPSIVVNIGWNDDDPDETCHLVSPLALLRSTSGPWWIRLSRFATRRIWMKWPALCGESLHTLTVGDLIEDVTCVDCEVARIMDVLAWLRKGAEG